MALNIDTIREFWEKNPLFAGESQYPAGTKEYFEEHRAVTIADGHSGRINRKIFPDKIVKNALDAGCGPGFWTVELLLDGKIEKMTACDLTQSGVDLCKKRLEGYGLQADVVVGNVEQLPFPDNSFDYISCIAVVHYTPNPEQGVKEIARVLAPGGTAVLSVYYKNALLRNWAVLKVLGKLAYLLGARFAGRGREAICAMDNADDIVRMYDGADNPLAKAYDREEFAAMMSRHFHVQEIFYHYFPARSLPFRTPRWLHRLLETLFPFAIVGRLGKKQ